MIVLSQVIYLLYNCWLRMDSPHLSILLRYASIYHLYHSCLSPVSLVSFSQTCPAPGVAVMVVSTINTSPSPVSNFQLQVAVPKVSELNLMYIPCLQILLSDHFPKPSSFAAFISSSILLVRFFTGDENQAAAAH